MKLSRSLLAGACALLASACGTSGDPPPAPAPGGGSPIKTALFGADASDEGERLFGRECAFCHVGKATGTMMLERRLGKENAELIHRTDLQADYVKAVVRNGLMNMPPLSRVEVTDAELDAIAAYLARDKR